MDEFELEPIAPTSRVMLAKKARLVFDESVFFGLIIPFVVCWSVIELSVQLTVLPSVFWRGRQAFTPWFRLCELWGLVRRHWHFITRYFFVTRFRHSVQAGWQKTSARATELKSRIRLPDFSLAELNEEDVVNVSLFVSLLPSLITVSAFFVHCLVATFWLIATWNIHTYYSVEDQKPAVGTAPPVVVYQPQIADKQEADYGPWFKETEVAKEVRENPLFKNLVLLSDSGVVKYSQYFVGETFGFKIRNTEKVIGSKIEANGQVRFKDQHGKIFVLNVEQAFMFENDSAWIYMFSPSGQLLAIKPADLQTSTSNQ